MATSFKNIRQILPLSKFSQHSSHSCSFIKKAKMADDLVKVRITSARGQTSAEGVQWCADICVAHQHVAQLVAKFMFVTVTQRCGVAHCGPQSCVPAYVSTCRSLMPWTYTFPAASFVGVQQACICISNIKEDVAVAPSSRCPRSCPFLCSSGACFVGIAWSRCRCRRSCNLQGHQQR